jgi:MFS family permease
MNPRPDGSGSWIAVLGLALGPAVSNGFARFGYGLILPAMRSDLGWTYTQAGWINTANALGYMAGALIALRFMPVLGPARMFRWGMALCTLALCASGITPGFYPQTVWRIAAGIGGAPVFIGGGAMVAATFVSNPSRNALAIPIYFGGGGLGIFLSALGLPLILDVLGPAAWPLMWWTLGLASAAALAPSWWASTRIMTAPPTPMSLAARLPWRGLMPSLAGYFLFSAGYIVYMTFVVAWMRENGATGGTIAMTWAILGLATMVSPFLWRRMLARYGNGLPLALSCAGTGLGAMVPLFLPDIGGLVCSATCFGLSFFIVPSAVTAFSRKNLPQAQWGSAVAAYTTVFAVGQMMGPIGAGWLADAVGTLYWGMAVAAAVLFAGGLCAAMQSALPKPARH